MSSLGLFLIYSLALFSVMLLAEFFYKVLRVDTEWSRKIAHIGAGIVALTYPLFIHNDLIVLGLTLSFSLILFISKKLKIFQSIFSIKRQSFGELLFVWSSWLLFVLYQDLGNVIYFYLPFSILVFADPAAALIGQKYPIKKYRFLGHPKSLGGSLSFFIASLVLSYYFASKYLGNSENVLLFAFIQASILSLIEAISHKGWDNLTIPLFSVLLIYFWF